MIQKTIRIDQDTEDALLSTRPEFASENQWIAACIRKGLGLDNAPKAGITLPEQTKPIAEPPSVLPDASSNEFKPHWKADEFSQEYPDEF